MDKYFNSNYTKHYSIILFFFVFLFFIFLKPNFLYNKKGVFRNFGLGKKNSTIIPIWLFIIILSILSYVFILVFTRN